MNFSLYKLKTKTTFSIKTTWLEVQLTMVL